MTELEDDVCGEGEEDCLLDDALLMLLLDKMYAPGICCRRSDICGGFGSFGDFIDDLFELLIVGDTRCVNSRLGGGSTTGLILIVDIDFLRSSAYTDTLCTTPPSTGLAGEGWTAF